MDLGISGRTAIVCASSRGIGKACAMALAEAGASVVVNGRESTRLEETADEIRTLTGAEVISVSADITTGEGQAALLGACPQPDILITNNGAPPYLAFLCSQRAGYIIGQNIVVDGGLFNGVF